MAIVCVAQSLAPITSADAARIDYETTDHGTNIISIVGDIEITDTDRFSAIQIDPSLKTFVLLYSRGGNVIAALQIGEMIHRFNFNTYVPSGATCASACGLIWLAGEKRLISATAQVGFHAAYTMTDGVASESGVSNAIVGAYLTRLGLSYAAVAFVTSAPPDGMQWLHANDAHEHDIDVFTLDVPTPSATRVTTAPAKMPVPTREQQARAFVVAYFNEASGSGSDVHRLEPLYAEVVDYYGADVLRSKVMAEKAKFAARWPMRQYTVDPATLSVRCSRQCVVSGVVAWDTSSEQRSARSTGTATVVLTLTGAGPIAIVAERSSVAAIAAAPKADAVSQSYVDGHNARAQYEAWSAKLLDGAYRDGAMWWAANRSNKPIPSCAITGASRDWLAGCVAAQTYLSAFDIRRKTERDFWLGWNSL